MSGSPLPTGQALDAVSAKPSKQAMPARDKAGDSAFDAVSRMEQRRLEQRDAALRAKKSEGAEQADRSERAESAATTRETGAAEKSDEVENNSRADDASEVAGAD